MKSLVNIKLAVTMAALVMVLTAAGQQMDEPQHFCGRKLAVTLSIICYENYNDSEKRSLSFNSLYDEAAEQFFPWIPKRHARIMELPARGKRQYIVDECCHKPCSLRKMSEYC